MTQCEVSRFSLNSCSNTRVAVIIAYLALQRVVLASFLLRFARTGSWPGTKIRVVRLKRYHNTSQGNERGIET